MELKCLIILVTYVAAALGQQRGAVNNEIHPALTTYKCTKAGGCVAQSTKVVLDADWRWIHGPGPSYKQCFDGTSWDSTLCPDPTKCAQNCALDGANYGSTYGITTSTASMTLKMFPSASSAGGTRVFLLSDDNHYQQFSLKNQEISFDVDVSSLPCGTNGAMYLLGMDADGGQSKFPNNKAGAYMGTGYCDAQCPRYSRFINGEANFLHQNDPLGSGPYGSCCTELDIWEANSISTDLSLHPCTKTGQYRCNASSGTDCNVCDGVGCDFNPYRMGNQTFYGPGGTVSTNPGKIRVVTQFITSNNSASGTLVQIRRLYIRGGFILNAQSRIAGIPGDMLTEDFCNSESSVFSPPSQFASNGGMTGMAAALDAGMVLAISIWMDPAGHMRTLDGVYPSGASGPGAARGSCPDSAGNPQDIRSQYPNTQVTFSNIRWGELDSTYPLPWP